MIKFNALLHFEEEKTKDFYLDVFNAHKLGIQFYVNAQLMLSLDGSDKQGTPAN